MSGTFEVNGNKNGKDCIMYYTAGLYEGVVNDIIELFERNFGWKNVSVHLI